MSELSAHSVLPLFATLSDEQKEVFMQKAEKMLKKRDKPKKETKKDIYAGMDPKWHPDNHESLVAEIMNGF